MDKVVVVAFKMPPSLRLLSLTLYVFYARNIVKEEISDKVFTFSPQD